MTFVLKEYKMMISILKLSFILFHLRFVISCVPNRNEFYFPQYNYGGYLTELQRGQCDVFGSSSDYCSANSGSCHRLCNSDSDCIMIQDDGTSKFHKCVASTETQYSSESAFRSPGTYNICQCQSDAQCPYNELCRNGKCQCTRDSDCGVGRSCYWYGISTNEWANTGKSNFLHHTDVFTAKFCSFY